MAKEHIYKVQGMHCASCEILIEKKLLELPNVKSVDASTAKGEVVVEYEGDKPDEENLNKIFKQENYKFSDNASGSLTNSSELVSGKKANPTLVAFNIAIFIIIGFLLLDKAGVNGFMSVSSASSLPAFFIFGILASLSSCAALVGGIILSMSKQWEQLYGENSSTSKKLQPHMLFNLGRIIAYGIFGAVLGIVGSRLQISIQFTSFLIIAMSFLMIALGLQMLGLKAFRKFQLALPKSITRYVADEKKFQGKYLPFLMGAATIILPCGFTITAEGLAMLSSNALQGSLIMIAFVLGTTPVLFSIGLSSVKFLSKPGIAEKFSKVAGFLVLFFALFNMHAQMNVLGFAGFNFSSNQAETASASQDGLAPIVNGEQVIKMAAHASSDSPNYFKVKAGVPVRWEITADNARGCNSPIVATGLFSGAVDLQAGQTTVKEFTPTKSGRYRFSCSMGMVTGTIEVVN